MGQSMFVVFIYFILVLMHITIDYKLLNTILHFMMLLIQFKDNEKIHSEGKSSVINAVLSVTFFVLTILQEYPIGLSYILFVSCIIGISLTCESLFTTQLCSLFKTIIHLILCCLHISFKESMWSFTSKLANEEGNARTTSKMVSKLMKHTLSYKNIPTA
eukprot:329441_1